ncbi:fused response regulator/phosphatase [Rhodobacteraceae bacterium WD3A24]|nr:fused response regulator/phosphatase [Rhodobacteraceae bacterium WD3A24]
MRNILVVDDSRVQRRILSASLQRWGYAVLEAGSGEEALAICAAHDVHLVVSDWMMPEMSGLEFCRAFRALARESYGYFILLTSRREKGAVAEGLDVGADDFLAKPVHADELRARIMAGERILRMEGELQTQNRLMADTLHELRTLYDSLDRDLAQARRLQMSLLPAPERVFAPARVSVMLRPSGHVGGDLAGYFPIGEQRLGLFAFDVSGHGVASALMTARLAGLLSGAAPEQNIALVPDGGSFAPRPPARVAAELNALVQSEVVTDEYFTLVYADVDLDSGRVRMVQAGHPHPAVQRACGRIEFVGEGGLPIGLISGAEWTGFELTLASGDRLFIMSDGVTECGDTSGAELGEAGVARLMRPLRGLHGRAYLDTFLARLGDVHGGDDFPDDVSGVLLEIE